MRWPGRGQVSFRNELRSPFIWFRDRISHWIESFDPERDHGANSIRNRFTFLLDSCKHCALKCIVTRGGMKKPKQAHSGSIRYHVTHPKWNSHEKEMWMHIALHGTYFRNFYSTKKKRTWILLFSFIIYNHIFSKPTSVSNKTWAYF